MPYDIPSERRRNGVRHLCAHGHTQTPRDYHTFINEGGTFSCKITGDSSDTFERGSLKSEGNLLRFSAINYDPYCSLEIDFNTVTNSYKFFTVFHDYYDSFKISVNGTDITSKVTKEVG